MTLAAAPSPTLPRAIRSYVAGYVRLRRWRAFWRRLGMACAFSIIWIVLCCLLDRLLRLPAGARLGLLAVHGLVLLVMLMPVVWRLVFRRFNWLEATAEIEQRDAELGERLQTVTSQLLEPKTHRGSNELIDHLAREVNERLVTMRPHRLVPRQPMLRPWWLAAGALLVVSALFRLPLLDLPTLLMRYAMPTAKIAPVTTTRLFVEPGDAEVVEGGALRVTATARRLGDEPIVLHVARRSPETESELWTQAPMTRPAGRDYSEASIARVDQDARYFLTGGDATSPVYNLHVLRRPVARQFRLHYQFPASTRKPPVDVVNADGSIEAPAGTNVTLSVVASEPLGSGTLSIGGQSHALLPTGEANVMSTTFSVWRDGGFELSLLSSRGVESAERVRGTIRAIPDRPPIVRLLGSAQELRLHPRDILSLPYQAADEYGLSSLRMRIEVDPSQAIDPGQLTNLARGKPTTQSSTILDADASRAVDGNSDGDFSHGSVTHTERAAGNYWQVDLGAALPISIIEIWNRTDVASERLSDFHVLVSDRPIDISTAADFPVSGVCGTPTTVDVYHTGRFVRVVLPKNDYLSLAEVRVYEAPSPRQGQRSPESGAASTDGVFDSPIVPVVSERALPLEESTRSSEGELHLDLADLNLRLGDVVTVWLRAADTAGQVTSSEACRVLISPRSVDLDTYRRISELEAAARSLESMAGGLDAALAGFDHASGRGGPDRSTRLPAVAQEHRLLSGVGDAASAGQTSLMRAVARGAGPALATTIASFTDVLESAGAVSAEVNARLTVDEAPPASGKGELEQAAGRVRQLRQELGVVLEGEKSAALMAEIQNFTASQRVPPQATRSAAERARQRLARMEQDIAAAARELSLDPKQPGALQAQLQHKMQAADALTASKNMLNFEPAAGELAARLKARAAPASKPAEAQAELGRSALDRRLAAAAQVESLRRDSDSLRATDLMLASVVAARLEDDLDAPASPAGAVTSPAARSAPAATSAPAETAPAPLSAEIFPSLLGALHREHELRRRPADQPVPAEEAEKVHASAEAARAQLAAWVRLEPESASSQPAAPVDDTGDQRRLEVLAFRASAAQAADDFSQARELDRLLVQEIARQQLARRGPEEDPDRGAAQARLSRMIARSEQLDRLSEAQASLQRDTQRAFPDADDREVQNRDLAERQRALADMIRRAAEAGATERASEEQTAHPDSRWRAEQATRSAQDRIDALPQAIDAVKQAALDRQQARQGAQVARKQADAAGLDQWASLNRTAVAAELQVQETEARLEQAASAVDADVSDALADALRPFAPETSESVRVIDEQLSPAMAGLKQALAADPAALERAAAGAKAAAAQASAAVKAAHAAIVADDPMLEARSAASAAEAALSQVVSTPVEALARQKQAMARQEEARQALARASQQATRQAATMRLEMLPAMAPILSPLPPSASAVAPLPETPAATRPSAAQAGAASLFQALRDWGRLQWRLPTDWSAVQQPSDPPGYHESLQAYFEAINRSQAPATAPSGGGKP